MNKSDHPITDAWGEEQKSSYWLDKMEKSDRRLQRICHYTWMLSLMVVGHWMTVIQSDGLSLTTGLMLGVNVIAGYMLRKFDLYYEKASSKR